MELPLAPVEKILKKSNMRASEDAVKEFATLLEEVIFDIAAEATSIAKSEGRKTVLLKDVLKARKKLG